MTETALANRGWCVRLAFVAGLTLGCEATTPDTIGPGELRVETVSSRPYLVSGGEALVRIEPLFGSTLSELSVTLNGEDVTDAFEAAPPDWFDRETVGLLGLVEGLIDGGNRLEVREGGVPVASFSLVNYPSSGPIISGDRLEPYLCLDELAPDDRGSPRRFALGNGAFLEGPFLGEDCSVETRVDFLYRAESAGGVSTFKAIDDPTRLPDDAIATTTSTGETVPYVVRLETGTVNRAIYQTAMLVDPHRLAPSPWARPSGWNGRLVYTYGGGCEAGFFQGPTTGGVLRHDLLSKGYAVASSTLNVNRQGGCHDVLSAETTMMVKERFIETVGPPLHTIGRGGSGGAMQQLLIAGAYPGLLDGLLITATFPDAVTYFIDTSECRLPLRRFLNRAGLDAETKRVVGGWATWETCNRSLGDRPNRIGPDDCPQEIPVAARYHPVRNPSGVRCSIYDAMTAIFGTTDSRSRSPHDTVGVQYGLVALNEGRIPTALFLDLNERVGGWDADFTWRPHRTEADPETVRTAYETGRVTSGQGGLAATPIIDERTYRDLEGNFHASYYSFVLRERLIRDNDHANGYVLQRHGAQMSRADENMELMDEWLTTLAERGGGGDRAAKLAAARPEALEDSCWNEDGMRVTEAQTFDPDRLFDNTEGRCNRLYPIHTGPRMVAGGPLTNDVLKCQLKPLDPADYDVAFTQAEWARLGRIFPDGVCDWSKPGVGQSVRPRTWLSFGPSPVNRYTPEDTHGVAP